MAGNNNRLYGLDSLRAIFAIVLLLGHIPLYFDGLSSTTFHLPANSVFGFFALSGFLAGYRRENIYHLADYYKKKAIRLLPTYYLWLLIVFIVITAFGQYHFFTEGKILYYLFLLPNVAFVTPGAIIDPYSNLWFIGSIVMFYLIFPLVAKNKGKRFYYVSGSIVFIWAVTKLLWGGLFEKNVFYRFICSTSFDCMLIMYPFLWTEVSPS